eukprot:418825_1
MLTRQTKIRAMSKQRRNTIQSILQIPIVVNANVRQKCRDYDFEKHRARPYRQTDASALLEFASYPFKEDNEWICISQWDDEDVMLRSDAFVIMAQHEFYRNEILSICESNACARMFVMDYVQSLNTVNVNKNKCHQLLAAKYLKRLFIGVVKELVAKRVGSYCVEHKGKEDRGIFIPSEIWKSSLQSEMESVGEARRGGVMVLDVSALIAFRLISHNWHLLHNGNNLGVYRLMYYSAKEFVLLKRQKNKRNKK